MIKVTLAQLNLTVGDMDGNVQRMIQAAERAHDEQAEVVVFSELSLTGYTPGDLLLESDFMARVDAALETLSQASRQIPALHWVVGLPLAHTGPGKRLYNALRVLRNGEVLLEYAKQLLPTYNTFDERRHFEPGRHVAKVLRIGNAQVGFLIGEDGWNDTRDRYAINPWDRLKEAAPDLVISINASPSSINVREQRHEMFAAVSQRHGWPILYVNQVGGQDQLVYDGASFAVQPQGGVVFEARRFDEDLCTVRLTSTGFTDRLGQALPALPPEGLGNSAFYHRQIVLGLRDYARRCGFQKALVGSSGGIDSAITLALATEALGAENVVAVTMPSTHSSAGSVDDSKRLCDNLGITLHHHPIAELVQVYAQGFQAAFAAPLKGLALENLQARIRGTVLMEYANTWGHLLLTTGNKSEVSVGYCTLYGDTNGGLSLIGDIYKTEVFALSRHLNEQAGRELIPVSIIDKPPSAELAPDQLDTDSLPPYELLDEVLKHLIEGDHLAPAERESAQACVAQLLTTPDGTSLVDRVRRLIARSEHKRRQMPPVIRVRARAFGAGRQIPITAQQF